MTNKINRRKFIANSAKAGVALTLIPSFLQANDSTNEMNFSQQPLPYHYNALEPYIDAATMEIHYTKHAAAYTKNLNEAVAAEVKSALSLEDILSKASGFSAKMRNNAGGHYNHELFWQTLTPTASLKPSGKLADALNNTFGSFENFQTALSQAALTRFGSGWAWLIESNGVLKITSTPNQDNPLMDAAETKGFPLLGIDVWEHAYYLKYQNKRAEYIKNWWNIINWSVVEKRFNK
ncbi:MAG: superoxide dismutase [Chitinophagaceae bacterium]|nr:superoxide dismutase [Chitinophagaceae bacterium]